MDLDIEQRRGVPVDTRHRFRALDDGDAGANPYVPASDADRHPLTRNLSMLSVMLGVSATIVLFSASQLLGSTEDRADVVHMVSNFYALAGLVVGVHYHYVRMAEHELVLRANSSGVPVTRMRSSLVQSAACYALAFYTYYGMASDSYAHEGVSPFKLFYLALSLVGHGGAALLLWRFRNSLVIDDVGSF